MRNKNRITKLLIHTDIQLFTLHLIGIYFHLNISLLNIDNTNEFKVEPIDGGHSAKISYIGPKAGSYNSLQKSTEVTVTDDNGTNSIKFTLAVGLDLEGLEVCASGCSYDNYGKCHVYSLDTYPEVTFWLRDKVTKEKVPRFDESMIIEGGSTSCGGGKWMKLKLKSKNESNGTFVLMGTQDLTPGESTEVSFACNDYFGKYIGGAIWW